MSKIGIIEEGQGIAMAAVHTAGNLVKGGKLVTKWDVQEVCEWLQTAGFGDLSPIFQKHQVSGIVLSKLNDPLLKEMGIDVIGKRLLLMVEVVKIQAIARTEYRNEVIWSAMEYREGPCNNSLPFGWPFACESCVGLPGQYSLTNSKLNISQYQKNCNMPGFGFCGFSVIADNYDLSDITDVDVIASSAAFGEKAGFVTINSTVKCVRLTLKSSECQTACMLITNAKEEAATTKAMMMMR